MEGLAGLVQDGGAEQDLDLGVDGASLLSPPEELPLLRSTLERLVSWSGTRLA